MKKKIIFILMSLCSLWGAAGSLLKNADFSEKSEVGFPKFWRIRAEKLSQITFKDSVAKLKLEESGKSIFLIYANLPLEQKKNYQISYKVRSKQKSPYRFYAEWITVENGKQKWHSADAREQIAGPEWQKRSFDFIYPDTKIPAYMAINLRNKGEVEFKDIVLEEYTPQLVKNADISQFGADGIPLYWKRRGESKDFKYIKNGFVHLKNPEKHLFHIQENASAFKAGKTYKVTYEVESPNNGQYRCYFEWVEKVNGSDKRRGAHTTYLQAPSKWQKYDFSFTLQGDMVAGHIVCNTKPGSEVAFRNINITEVKKGTLKHSSGGVIRTIGKSQAAMVDKKAEIEVYRVKTNTPGAWLDNVGLEKGKTYKLTYQVIGKGEGDSMGFYAFAVKVKFANKSEVCSPWDDVWGTSFQTKYFIFTVPADIATSKVDIGFECYSGKGSVLFKNISIAETTLPKEKKCKVVLESPYYRNMIFSTAPVDVIKGRLYCKVEADKAKVFLSGNSEKIASQEVVLNKNNNCFSMKVSDLKVGKYVLQIDFFNKTELVASEKQVIEKLAPAASEVIVKEGNKFYVNGKIFYPIICMNSIARSPEQLEESLYYASRNGMNTFITGGPEQHVLKVLDIAQNLNMKVFLRAGISSRTDEVGLQMWKHQLYNNFTGKVRSHPALLGYFLCDEPMWAGIPFKRLIMSYNALKEVDPYHPVWINAAPRGTVKNHARYSLASDIYGVDIYPVPYPNNHSGLEDKRLTCVGKYAQRMSEAVDFRKPIIMCLQGYASADMVNRKIISTGVYPTLIQSRFMAYDSVIKGAYVCYWGTQYILKKSFYDTMFKVTDELNRMSGLLTKGRKIKGFSSDNDKIVCYALECDGKKYLIALNASHEKQNCVIKTAFSGNECIELYENRKVELRNSAIKTSFIPYGVNIYGEAELPPPAVKKAKLIPEMEKKGNPFHNYLDNLKNVKYYHGSASWIWDNKTWNVARSKTVVGKTFEVKGRVSKATLFFAIDDMGAAYINGKKVADALGWSAVKALDCTELIKQGKNSLVVSAADAGHLPCGILVELKIVFDSGKTMTVISDSSWLGNENSDGKLPTAGNLGSWNRVKVIAPYGSGAWKSNVKMVK